MSASPQRTEDAVRAAWETPSLVRLDVGDSEKGVTLPTEGITSYGNVTYGPS